MSPLPTPPDIAPLDDTGLAARQAHLEREIARSAARAPARRLLRGAIVVTAGLVAAAVLLTGRGSGTDAVAKALAAVSRGPYLGVVTRGTGPGSSQLVYFGTHTTERVHYEAELWFDTRKHGVAANIGGCTRMIGSSTRTGCIGSAFEYADSVVITGSIDRYRTALATGRVHKTTSGIVRGRQVWWLRITPSRPLPIIVQRGYVSYVAVDQKTGNPLRIETRKHGRVVGGQDIDVLPETHRLPSYVLTLAELLRRQAGLALSPGRRHQRSSMPVTLEQASRAVPGAVWPGRTAGGQSFRLARVLTLDDGSKQLELLYGGACPRHCVLIKQSTEAGWAPGYALYTALPDQTILINGPHSADGRAGNMRIRIEGTGRAGLLAVARALRPLRP